MASVVFNFFIKVRMMRIFRFDTIDSTNRYLKEMEDKKELDCVIAKTQSAGVGRRGNTWVSKEGMALFSFAVSEDSIPTEHQNKIALIAGASLLETLKKYEDLDFKFKWTNDIYLNDKKLSGILIEKVGKWFVIGIGININNKELDTVEDKATSLILNSNRYYNVEDIIFSTVNDFKNYLTQNSWNYTLSQINRNNYLENKMIEVVKDGVSIGVGTAKNIANDGTLEVEIDGEIRYFDIGEIHIKR